PQAARISAPDENDLKVPLEEEAVISRAAAQIGIIGKEDKAVVAALDRYFQKNFSYSLDLSLTPGVSAIEDFLFNSRSGHCEYFATATVLLLREAGIPARYFVGYLASEYSAMEDAFIVRSRDAHAWPMAYIDGSWRLVDTTPYSWLEADRENSHALEGFHDLLSYLFLQFSRWRWGEITLFNTQRLALLLIPLFLLLGWRIVSTIRLSRKKEAAFDRRQKSHVPGTASVFYLVERRLNELGYTRASWETEAEFIHRVISLRTELHGETALALLELHYRLRFDPKGLTEAQKEKMIHLTGLWLEQSRNVAPSPAVSAAAELEPNL
ncbi:MAG: transglutaminase-like domain-containing protein, partial [Nitrospinota bacterium]|nr:transglutaminase-like domain-containing protein [Nitrospinota bacterium]